MRHPALVTAVLVALTGCAAVGPDYVRPAAAVPAQFKELEGFAPARPLDDVPKGAWWTIYGVPELDALEQQVGVSNQNVAQAEAQYRAARAGVDIARAGQYPIAGASASSTRSRSHGTNGGSPAAATVNDLGVAASWEPDFWGRVRRSVEAGTAGAQASAADLETMRLSMQAELAQDYFRLRALDALQGVLDQAVKDDRELHQLTRNRYAAGVAAWSDVVQAQAQLLAAQAQATDVGAQRAAYEHAIAVLVGQPPAELSLTPKPLHAAPPDVPAGIPSELLQRRPDIAAAERRVAAANAQIGVAQAAFYPTLTLSASLGTSFASALGGAPLLWSLGPALAQTILDGGARQGRKAQAVADYDATVAAYRQTVLTGFQEVEDQLAALRQLGRESVQQANAVTAAREAVRLAVNQYRAGTVSYLNVLSAQQTALADEQSAVNIDARRFVASVSLVRALGGGWSLDPMPDGKTPP